MNPPSSARLHLFALFTLLALAWPSVARAELVVTTLEHGAWPASVAALQHNLQSQNSVVHVVVTDETGRRAPCGEYTLTFDEVGAAAFAMGACDVSTQATALLLRQRSALFEHGDLIARPLPVAITAVQTRTGSVSGGALSAGGSEVTCSVAVRPFLRDMETGAVVHLTPGRFVLRPLGAGVTASIDADGWNLTGSSASLAIEYEVVDTQRREVVLHDRATLQCGAADLTVAATPPDPSCGTVLPLDIGRAVAGSTQGATHRFSAGCGAGAPGPDVMYALTIPTPSRVQIRLSSNFDGVLSLRAGCDLTSNEIACNDDAPDTRHSFLDRTLMAGTYYVVIDGYSVQARGDFELSVSLSAPGSTPLAVADGPVLSATPDTVGITCANALPLPHDGSVHGSSGNASDQMHATCGASASSPERVYALVLDGRARVRLRLTSDYDGVLYVRSGCGDGVELGCNDDDADTRHSSLDLTLDAGTYYVFVDGYASSHSGQYDLSVRVDFEHVGVDLRAGMTYAASGTDFGGGLGFAATSQLRVPLGSVNLMFGARYGIETFSRGESESPTTLRVMTVSAPVGVDFPLFDGSFHLYSVLDPGWVRARQSVAASGAAPSSETAVTGFAMSVGQGVSIFPSRSFGLYAELNYRIANLTSPDGAPWLSNGASFACGLTSRF